MATLQDCFQYIEGNHRVYVLHDIEEFVQIFIIRRPGPFRLPYKYAFSFDDCGIEYVPKDGTYLLDRNERVLSDG
ncbi:hypothetical protein [Pseudomonas putida]|uniref:Uncharacterized protein n=1 Tax=Pseudomonas putida TaxID=303 RepID=A0A1X0ZME0_PSEPU|nr:hypothetical protein [Pseudomonas putida]ORL58102.1 hypothetical protein B7H17_26255 [Pseudomonas putida]